MLEESMSTGTVPSSIWASILSWFTPTVFFVFVNLTIGTIYFTSTLANSNKPDRQEGDEPNPKLVRSPSVLQKLKSINLYSYRSPEPVSATAYEKVPDLDDDSHHLHFSFQQQLQQQQTPELEQRRQEPFLDRSPSVLQRIRSFNLSSCFSPEPTSLKSREIYAHYTPKQVSREEEQHGQEQEPEHEEEEEEEEEDDDDDDDFQGGLELEEEIKGEERSLDEVYSQLKDSGHVTRTKSDTKPASGEILTKLPKKMRKSASVKSAFSHFEEDDIVETRRPATVREGKAKATEEDEEVDARADDFINKFKQQLKLQRIDSILRYKDGVNRGNGR